MSTVEQEVTLGDLEARAGASDQDRELWLAERRAGITATEVRDLYLGKLRVQQLIDLKLGRRVDSFTANQYAAWGKKREPVIAAWVEQRFGIRDEHRVFHAQDNSRFLASPDGTGVDFFGNLVVDEIKTGKDDLTPGAGAYEAKGYEIQQTWSMRVTGARRSLYAHEQHDSDWQDRGGDYLEPAPLHDEPRFEWREYNAELAAELEVIAVGFLVALDAAAAGDAPELDDELDTLGFNVLKFREAEASAKKSKEQVWKELQVAAAAKGKGFSQESLLARVTYSPGVTTTTDSTTTDVDAAKAADPELWESLELLREQWDDHLEKYKTTVPVSSTSKATLTVTAPKIKETKK